MTWTKEAIQRRLEMTRRGEPRDRRSTWQAPSSGNRALVQTSTLRRLLEPMVNELGEATVAALAGINNRSLYRVLHEQDYCTVEMADKLICDALDDPSIWWVEPGLEVIQR